MNTNILGVDPASIDPTIIAHAAALIRAGQLVAFPTETVYGLGANALDSVAVRGIFTAKGRPASNPLIVHVADPSQVVNVAEQWPETAKRLAAKFWPGPLTLVVPRKLGIPDDVTAGGPTVAVRCPNHSVARELIRVAGVPIAGPSANRSTELSPTRAEHVLKGLGGSIDLILDAGPCVGGIESTVVDVTGPVPRLLRPGLITVPMLEEVVGKVELANRERERSEPIARSPGQMAKHYSPRTPVVLTPFAALRDDQLQAAYEDERTGVIGFEATVLGWLTGAIPPHFVAMPPDPMAYAAQIYAAMHHLDQACYARLLIELPPDTPEWAAVRDRLTRAAGGGK